MHTVSNINHICFNESDYVMLHFVMNIRTENGPKMSLNNAAIMVCL